MVFKGGWRGSGVVLTGTGRALNDKSNASHMFLVSYRAMCKQRLLNAHISYASYSHKFLPLFSCNFSSSVLFLLSESFFYWYSSLYIVIVYYFNEPHQYAFHVKSFVFFQISIFYSFFLKQFFNSVHNYNEIENETIICVLKSNA